MTKLSRGLVMWFCSWDVGYGAVVEWPRLIDVALHWKCPDLFSHHLEAHLALASCRLGRRPRISGIAPISAFTVH